MATIDVGCNGLRFLIERADGCLLLAQSGDHDLQDVSFTVTV